jgi:lysylphosphatidylglycerol synthetase-like protein (DUF2156 family)
MNASESLYRKSYFTSSAYIVAVLLFLLPFVEIKCNNKPYAENTGIGLSLGRDYKLYKQIDTSDEKSSIKIDVSSEKGKLYVSALIALILGLAGIVISLTNQKRKAVNMILGALAAISLMILALQIKNDLRDQTGVDNFKVNNKEVTYEFTLWYYLSITCFLAASFFSFKQAEWSKVHGTPPSKAPQTPIHNPGEQSEFPTSPDESELER